MCCRSMPRAGALSVTLPHSACRNARAQSRARATGRPCALLDQQRRRTKDGPEGGSCGGTKHPNPDDS